MEFHTERSNLLHIWPIRSDRRKVFQKKKIVPPMKNFLDDCSVLFWLWTNFFLRYLWNKLILRLTKVKWHILKFNSSWALVKDGSLLWSVHASDTLECKQQCLWSKFSFKINSDGGVWHKSSFKLLDWLLELAQLSFIWKETLKGLRENCPNPSPIIAATAVGSVVLGLPRY